MSIFWATHSLYLFAIIAIVPTFFPLKTIFFSLNSRFSEYFFTKFRYFLFPESYSRYQVLSLLMIMLFQYSAVHFLVYWFLKLFVIRRWKRLISVEKVNYCVLQLWCLIRTTIFNLKQQVLDQGKQYKLSDIFSKRMEEFLA